MGISTSMRPDSHNLPIWLTVCGQSHDADLPAIISLFAPVRCQIGTTDEFIQKQTYQSIIILEQTQNLPLKWTNAMRQSTVLHSPV